MRNNLIARVAIKNSKKTNKQNKKEGELKWKTQVNW
jgi:hypothetical protein